LKLISKFSKEEDGPMVEVGAGIERRVHDLEHVIFGNGRPGVLTRFDTLSGKIEGALWGLGIAGAIMLALLVYILTSIGNLENSMRTQGVISHESPIIVQHSNPPLISTK